MRKFICVACGAKTMVNHCNGRSCRDISCPDCGGKMVRDHSIEESKGNQVVTGRNQNSAVASEKGKGNAGCRMNRGCGQQRRRRRAV